MYLTTRDATAHFTPDLCSRVTLVNFTVTRAGLTAQCLSQMMQAERPDVEARREAALKQQGETRVALRAKEKELLDCISGLSQSLLQDDQAVKKLEGIKSEAAAMTRQAEQSEGVMAEVKAAQDQFQGLAERCAGLFFAVEGLQLVHFLYQVSLHQFQSCFGEALRNGGSVGIEDRLTRLLYNRISRGLLEVHRPALALRLALARLRPQQTEIDYLLGNEQKLPATLSASSTPEWKAVLEARDGENLEGEVWKLVHSRLGWGESEGEGATLGDMARGEQLVLLVGTLGNDPAPLVDELAAASKPVAYQRIAMGSAEGFLAADKAVVSMSKQGGWLLLRNVHLAPSWLVSLEKRLHAARPLHPNFRLFLVSDAHPSLPTALLRACRVLLFETPPGLRSAVLHNLRACPPPRAPAERAMMRYLVCHGHALVTERLRFAPLGWSKQLAFSSTDLAVALRTVDAWIDALSPDPSRPNLDPAALPWQPVSRLLCQVVYGGRIDNDQDQRLLESLWASLLCPASFSDPSLPDPAACKSPLALEQWAATHLPETTPPQMLGLPATADSLLRAARARDTLRALAALFARESSDESQQENDSSVSVVDEEESASVASAHLAKAALQCRQWLALLPAQASCPALARLPADASGPLPRFWRREAASVARLLRQTRARLQALAEAGEGKTGLTNDSRALLAEIRAGSLAPAWQRALSLPRESATTALFVADLARRMEALASLEACDKPCGPFLGGLLAPSALLTASRQHACAVHGWPLEQVTLSVSFQPAANKDAWQIHHLAIQGAELDGTNALALSRSPASTLPSLWLSWHLGSTAASADADQGLETPFYLAPDRKQLLFSAKLPVSASVSDPQTLVRSGLAVIAWTAPTAVHKRIE